MKRMGFYDRYILPRLIGCACGAKPIAKQRAKIAPQAEGVVLELGFGSGLNLPFYDPAKVARVIAVEPSLGMISQAEKAIASSPVPVEVRLESAERLSVPDASVDTVVLTYALCTVSDTTAALNAARRALRPGGRLLFCEHGLAPDPRLARFQRRLEPLWSRLAGGCRLTRDAPSLIEAAGFRLIWTETMYLPGAPRWAGFNAWGEAVAA
jgi:ubiquinone/menaquinone biosynthesis C-methylase UbiE